MNLDRFYEDLEYLVNIDSGTVDGHAGIDRIADFLADRFKDLGWQTKKHDLSPNAGPTLICTNREAENYDLLMIGHLDTVFTLGTIEKWSFSMDDKYAYGPGVHDMKSGVLFMYYLMKELPKEVGEKLNIVAVFNSDEETSSLYSKEVYAEYAKRSRYAFVFEGMAANGTSRVERKGGLGYIVKFTGVAGHCGSVFINGAKSAVHEMGKWIVALSEMQDEAKGTSVNVGIARGGTKKNIVAPEAYIEVDIRIDDNEEPLRFDRAIEALTKGAKERGIGVEITRRFKPALVYTEKVAEYAEHVKKIASAAGIPIEFQKGGGLSDANILASYGAVCLDGIGPAGDGSHSEREVLFKETVPMAYDRAMLLICDLAEQKK